MMTTMAIGGLILVETALSFLCLGVHLVIFSGLLITITAFCLYMIGDGLRDALDPMMRGR